MHTEVVLPIHCLLAKRHQRCSVCGPADSAADDNGEACNAVPTTALELKQVPNPGSYQQIRQGGADGNHR